MARILVGTSGWSYAAWRGPFFPRDLPAKHHLEYYASQFETVELNGIFYRTPTAESVGRWRDDTGRHFVFAWKASKFEVDAGRLGSFLELLPRRRQYSFEFRHPSWYAGEIFRLLSDQNIALCISDHHDAPHSMGTNCRLRLFARTRTGRPL
jgi:uncharacterized protein YecE (DUF72 family)